MTKSPVLFLSHGSPAAAVNDDSYARKLGEWGKSFSSVRAVVVASAHGLTPPPAIEISGSHRPSLIYDFYGFPEELYRVQYACPGSPSVAARVKECLSAVYPDAKIDNERGLDHGVWVPLKWMFPRANLPVVQVTIPYPSSPASVFQLGARLSALRDEGILLIGSGGAVHNLKQLAWRDANASPEPWALTFHAWLIDCFERGDWESILNFAQIAPDAARAHPTPEHFYPIFFTLGALAKDETMSVEFSEFRYGNLSMLCAASANRAPGR